jgi:hypothetical protein
LSLNERSPRANRTKYAARRLRKEEKGRHWAVTAECRPSPKPLRRSLRHAPGRDRRRRLPPRIYYRPPTAKIRRHAGCYLLLPSAPPSSSTSQSSSNPESTIPVRPSAQPDARLEGRAGVPQPPKSTRGHYVYAPLRGPSARCQAKACTDGLPRPVPHLSSQHPPRPAP